MELDPNVVKTFRESWNTARTSAKTESLRSNTKTLVKSAIKILIPPDRSDFKLVKPFTYELALMAFEHFDVRVTEGSIPSFDDLLAFKDPVSGPLLFRVVSGQPEVAAGSASQYAGNVKAFNVPFVSTGYVSLFRNHLAKSAKAWSDKGNYYAPFLAVINASMTGKSRLVLELAYNGVFLFPMCLRAEVDSRMRPPRTPFIADWASRPGRTLANDLYPFTNEGCVLFHRSLEILEEWLKEKVRQHAAATCTLQELAVSWAEHIAAREQQIWKSVADTMESKRTTYPKQVCIPQRVDPVTARAIADEWKADVGVECSKIHGHLQTLVKSYEKQDKLQIVFFFDEARQFYRPPENQKEPGKRREDDMFVWFRRSMRCLPFHVVSGVDHPGPYIFCVVTDTSSTILNLAPALCDDASLRSQPEHSQLHDPFFLLKTQDLWWDKALTLNALPKNRGDMFKYMTFRLLKEGNDHKWEVEPGSIGTFLTRDLMTTFWFMAMFGRPYHFSFFGCKAIQSEGPSANAVSDDLVSLMKAKLLNNASYDFTKVTFVCSDIQAVAVLGALAAVEISARSTKASELSAKHMRLLAGISIDRERAFTIEPIDPVLAMAARELVMEGTVQWHELLYAISKELKSTTMTGCRGELGGQVLLLMAWQEVLLDSMRKKGDALRDGCEGGEGHEDADEDEEDGVEVDGVVVDELVVDDVVVVDEVVVDEVDEKDKHQGEDQDQDDAKGSGRGRDEEKEEGARELDSAKKASRGFPMFPVMKFLEKLYGTRIEALKAFVGSFDVNLEQSFWDFMGRLVEAGVTDGQLRAIYKFVKPLKDESLALLVRASEPFRKIGNLDAMAEKLRVCADLESVKTKLKESMPADSVNVIGDFISKYEDREIVVTTLTALSRLNSVAVADLQTLKLNFDRANRNGSIVEVVRARISLQVWKDMKTKLRGGYVRVQQFAKTFCRVSKRMLWEAFVRGVAIYCMENQPVIDLCIPVFFPDRSGTLQESALSAVVVQIKLQEKFESNNFKLSWLDNVLDLSFLADSSPVMPFVSLFCEFGPVEDLEPSKWHTAIEARSVGQKAFQTTHKRDSDGQISRYVHARVDTSVPTKGYAIFTRGLSVYDVWQPGPDAKRNLSRENALKAFKFLLESSIDPSKSSDVKEHAEIRDMFRAIAYLEPPQSVDSKSKTKK